MNSKTDDNIINSEIDGKKIKLSSELLFFLAISLIAFSVALASAANMGLSMIAAPSFILWSKWPELTIGQWEYVVEGIHLVVFCIVVRRFRLIYLFTAATGLIYGALLDLFRLIPFINPGIHEPGSYDLWIRISLFALSILLCAAGVAMMFRTYIFPQIFDFFVKYVPLEFKLDRIKFKRLYDLSLFVISLALSLILFGGIVGIGWGTVFITAVNGILIGKAYEILNKYVDVYVRFKKLPEIFLIK